MSAESAINATERDESPSVPRADHASRELSVWERVSFVAIHTAVALMLRVLSLPGLYQFGRIFGTLEWAINYKRRRRFARAFEEVLGYKPTVQERSRESLRHFVQTRCDKMLYLIFDCLSHEQAQKLLVIENEDLLVRVLNRGQGLYFAMSHHGALHVMSLLMASRGYKIVGVRDHHEGALRRYVQSRIDKRCTSLERMRILYADAYPREIYRCLRDGFILGSAMDVTRVRHANQKTEEVTFLGEQRKFVSGPLWIAVRCKTPVLQAFIVPEPGFRYRLDIIEMLIDPDEVEDEEQTVSEAMRQYASNLENRLRQSPSLITRI